MTIEPCCALDDPRLKGGPYTQAQVDSGNIDSPDLGLIYGYCYQPERFTEPGKGVTGVSYSYPMTRDSHNRVVFGEQMPMCDTVEEAVAVLKKGGWYGRVQRYAKDEQCFDPDSRNYYWSSNPNGCGMVRVPLDRPYRPWMTAGVVCLVNVPKPAAGEPLTVYISLGEYRSDIGINFEGEEGQTPVGELAA